MQVQNTKPFLFAVFKYKGLDLDVWDEIRLNLDLSNLTSQLSLISKYLWERSPDLKLLPVVSWALSEGSTVLFS